MVRGVPMARGTHGCRSSVWVPMVGNNHFPPQEQRMAAGAVLKGCFQKTNKKEEMISRRMDGNVPSERVCGQPGDRVGAVQGGWQPRSWCSHTGLQQLCWHCTALAKSSAV